MIQPETIESWKILYGIEILPEAVEIIRIDLEGSPDPEDSPDPENGFDDEFDNEFELGMYQHFEDGSDLEDEGEPEDCKPEDFFQLCSVPKVRFIRCKTERKQLISNRIC